ncbi:ABC transporter ATP-binding protein [Marimonas arenosa]|uniref:ABC transporter ATP-binding protein n=1 Tax=Marimonas arenosa TaxID=1795305 RepID=A0AAE3WEA2_9RHOB|nr:ABC transporter ATP-binding protein [Marimonas arenosa]MDQ2090058.1 ABC transporter ATP-binding protein [Marimonas arenosa]
MIELRNLTKFFPLADSYETVLDNVNVTFPTGASVGLLGRNGAGKSTLLKIISGTIHPSSGAVISDGTISYPVGFSGSFHRELTGLQNTRFVARIYGVDTDELVAFVRDFAELGEHFFMPIRTYSSGMKSRLSFGISMGIPFDTYLVDEVTSVGDGAFREKSTQVFNARLKSAGAVVVNHNPVLIRRVCDMGAVLEDGRLVLYDDIDAALEHHEHNLQKARG